ncbi:hypothetical protein BC830DRAFT_1070116, partial [Chytriomyces sp. MP71]
KIEERDYYDPDEEKYFYPFPCGDRFAVTKVTLSRNLASLRKLRRCLSCTLIIKVVYDIAALDD